MTPDEVVEEVKKSGLRGCGGAGFPTGMKVVVSGQSRKAYPAILSVTPMKAEPGTFKDSLPDGEDPPACGGHDYGLLRAGCQHLRIYIRGEYSWILFILEKAIAEAYNAGWLGNNILGTGYNLDLYVNIGAGADICGEETALIESLEGKRGNPRIKPPFPAVKGLWQSPTVVNNVETIAAVVPIINDGGDEYAKIGLGRSTGTKLISASGNINRPGVYEIELNVPVEEFIYSDEYCGGIKKWQAPEGLCAGWLFCTHPPALPGL
jgi:NADH-quinone oxidoreductase subunit F